MTHYVVDTNVFLYARGRQHPYRQPCRRVLQGVLEGQVQLHASAELVQEFVHVLLRRGVTRQEAVDEATEVRRQCRLHAFDGQVLALALGLVRHYSALGARDAVHAATAVAIGIPQMLSANQVFDAVAEVDRVDPEHAAGELPLEGGSDRGGSKVSG